MPTFPAAQEARTYPSAQTGRVAPAAQTGRAFPPGDAPSVTPSKFMLFSRAHGGSNQLTATGSANYEPPAGSEYGGPAGQWGTEANQQFKTPVEIELSGLQSLTYTNTLTTAATTLRVRNAGANGNQVVSVPAGTTAKVTDASNTDTIASGALFCTSATVAASGTGLYTPGGARLVMQPTTDSAKHWALYGGYGGGAVLAGTGPAGWSPTSYNSNDPVGDQYLAFALWYCDATVEAFDFYVGANSLSVSTTFQLYINGSAVSGATKTVTAGATGRFSLDGLGAVALVSGDTVELRTTVPAGTGSIQLYTVSMWTSTARATPVAMMACQHTLGATINNTTTRYGALSGSCQNLETTEALVVAQHGFTGTASGMTVRVQANPSGTCTMRYRKGGADGNQVLTVSAAGTGVFRDTTNSDTFGPTDECCYSLVRSTTSVFRVTHMLTVEEYVSG